MGQVLYRKYRSKSLDEIVGQEHITRTLSQALQGDRISHAYLFTGPRGVGKTSIARILAHAINDLPYTADGNHIDIIEIDAASNRRIDEIRDLRDKVYVAPTSAKYKVYIIDEVHMLTKEAFNALLKTLEEPPAHVVFILATTDAHKLPETIVSRTQRFSFKPVDKAKVVEHLRHIAKAEKLTVSDEALALLAEHGEGSFRDSISLLDQASSQGRAVEADDVRALLGIPPAEALQKLLDAVSESADMATVASALTSLYDQGYQAATIAKQLGQLLRESLVNDTGGLSSDTALGLLTDLLEVPVAHDPERYLEIALLKPLRTDTPTRVATPVIEDVLPPEPIIEIVAVEIEPELEPLPLPVESIAPEAQTTTPKSAVKKSEISELNEAVWMRVLQNLKQHHNTLYGVVRMAEPKFTSNDELTLAFAFAFHQKRVNETRNQQLLVSVIEELTGQRPVIHCVVDKSATPPQVTVPTPQPATTAVKSDSLSTISNIFGGGELLES